MDVLVPGEGVELLDPGLHIVPGDLLALGDRGQVDLVEHPLVVGEGGVGHLDAEVLLGPQHGEPELTLQLHLLLGGPEDGQLGGGVAAGQDVGDAGLCGCGSHVYGFYWRFVQVGARDVFGGTYESWVTPVGWPGEFSPPPPLPVPSRSWGLRTLTPAVGLNGLVLKRRTG